MSLLTLSEKATLAASSVFRDRVMQAMFSKANFFLGQPVQNPLGTITQNNNLQLQKQKNYSLAFSKGAAGGIDIKIMTQLWLANFNNAHDATSLGTPVGFDDTTKIPYDASILDTAALDTVFNTYVGVVAGDNLNLPI